MKPCSNCGNEYMYMDDEQFKRSCDKDKERERNTRRKMRPSKVKRLPRPKGSRKGAVRRTR